MNHPWEKCIGGSKILERVVRAEQASGGMPDEKAAIKMACRMLRILHNDMQVWKEMFSVGKQNLTQMTPKAHEKTLEQLVQNARHLLENIEALNLPVNVLAYYPEAWPDITTDPMMNHKDFEQGLQIMLKWRDHGTRIDSWLKILTDKDLVKKVAPTSPLGKANVKNPQLSFTARMIARFFYTHYGKTLSTTIERICFIEFPDADVSNNTISAILRTFDHTQE